MLRPIASEGPEITGAEFFRPLLSNLRMGARPVTRARAAKDASNFDAFHGVISSLVLEADLWLRRDHRNEGIQPQGHTEGFAEAMVTDHAGKAGERNTKNKGRNEKLHFVTASNVLVKVVKLV